MDERAGFRRGLISVCLVLAAVGAALAQPALAALKGLGHEAGAAVASPQESTLQETVGSGTLVLAAADDPYYALAEEIAKREGVPLVGSLREALALDPEFLLWVISPSRMSDQVLVQAGLLLGGRESAVSLGIISGSTMDQARELWLRGPEVDGRLVVAANAANVSGHILSGIIVFGSGGTAYHPLTLANLQRYLQRADYLTFTGHGGGGHLELDPDTLLRSQDIPDLPPMVVATASCNTFRIWTGDSIALGFVDKGAAAYAGFAYSPNEGYLIGEFLGVPLRYTWPDFPIGHVVQVQNKGAVKGFASFPYYYLLGDPRTALQSEAPYDLVSDREGPEGRTLQYADAPQGFIPVRIQGAAKYSFVEIPGVSSSWEHEPFYNSRLQMVDLGDDKYVLFRHGGGDFSVILRPSPPWYWPVVDLLFDSLDHTLLYLPEAGGDVLALFLGGTAWLAILRLLRRMQGGRANLMASVATGAVIASLHAIYACTRLDDVTITSKLVQFGPVPLLGTFLITGCGAFLFLNGRSWRARVLAIVLGTLPVWAAICFSVAVITAVNVIVFQPELGRGAYNYALAVLPAGALVVESLLLLVCFSLAQWTMNRLRHKGAALASSKGDGEDQARARGDVP
jgi:hypothetical protein